MTKKRMKNAGNVAIAAYVKGVKALKEGKNGFSVFMEEFNKVAKEQGVPLLTEDLAKSRANSARKAILDNTRMIDGTLTRVFVKEGKLFLDKARTKEVPTTSTVEDVELASLTSIRQARDNTVLEEAAQSLRDLFTA